ncbi:MAG: hypothetical protein JWM80_1561 [Cyanobacteria bacterium RYN_339]|nr:hypothetical protein [Cyanobacteria bacterium RYN_339]
MIDPDKFPDIRPDRRRFWGLRLLAWGLTLGGLALFTFGAAHGTLAYYATKNGAEMERIYQALAYVIAASAGGLLLTGVGQAFRVVLAIEENTRVIAYHTRAKTRPVEETRERKVPAVPTEKMRL